jgi:hypothetical protein
MAHLHNFAKQSGVVLQQVGQKVKQVAEIAGSVKQIWDIGSFLKNAMTAAEVVLPIAAVL